MRILYASVVCEKLQIYNIPIYNKKQKLEWSGYIPEYADIF